MPSKFTHVLLLTIVFLIGLPTLHADEDKPPYLYYYSHMLGGIIIERADGTDSRHIGADVIPAGMSGIGGPGWSPSGKYFAGRGVNIGTYRLNILEHFVMDTSGQPVINEIETFGQPNYMEWSPERDILFMITGTGVPSMTFWLLDAESGKIMATLGTGIGSDYRHGHEWDVENERITFLYRNEGRYATDMIFKVTMNFDGSVTKEVVHDQTLPMHEIPPTDWDQQYGTATSPSGTYTTSGMNPALLTNTLTNETIKLPLHTQQTSCREYRWSSDESYIITLSGTIRAGGGCGSALIGITDEQGVLWREVGSCMWRPICVDWLPEQVDLSALPAGNPTSIHIDPVEIVYVDEEERRLTIADDEVNFYLYCKDEQTVNIVDADTRQLEFALTEIECPYRQVDSFASEGLPIMVAEHPDGDLLATYYDYSEQYVTIWKYRGNAYYPVLRLDTYGYQLEFSDDGQYLRAQNIWGKKVYSVSGLRERIGKSG